MTWARHSLTARTLAISAVFAVLLTAAFALLVVAIGSLREAGRTAVRAQQTVTAGTELEKSVLNLENGLKGYVATGRESQLAPFDLARHQYPDQVRRLQVLAKGDQQLRPDPTQRLQPVLPGVSDDEHQRAPLGVARERRTNRVGDPA